MKQFLPLIAYAIVFFLGVMATNAEADEAIVFGGWSSHSSDTYTDNSGEEIDYNENNYTLGYGRNNYYITVSKLSYYNWGITAYYDWQVWQWKHTVVSLRMGAVYGYHNSPRNKLIQPIILPTISQRLYRDIWFQYGVIGTTKSYVMTGNLLWRF